MTRKEFFDDIVTTYRSILLNVALFLLLLIVTMCSFRWAHVPHISGIDSVKAQYIGIHGELLTSTYNGIKKSSSKKIPTADYVFVDKGYEFNGSDNYHKVATYGDRIVYASQDFPLSKMNASDAILEKKWENAGLTHVNYDKTILKISRHFDLVSGYVSKVYGELNLDYGFDVARKLDPVNPNLVFMSDLILNPEYRIIETGEDPAYAKYDLYIRNGVEDTLPEFPGLEILDNDTNNSTLNILTVSLDKNKNPTTVYAGLGFIVCTFAYAFTVDYWDNWRNELNNERKNWQQRHSIK